MHLITVRLFKPSQISAELTGIVGAVMEFDPQEPPTGGLEMFWFWVWRERHALYSDTVAHNVCFDQI